MPRRTEVKTIEENKIFEFKNKISLQGTNYIIRVPALIAKPHLNKEVSVRIEILE